VRLSASAVATARQPAAPVTGRRPRPGDRGRAGGFDGLRALAVLAVVAFHENLPALPGGFLGVDVFFVLSGYLITDLLVARFDRSGRLGLRDFWIRRARRLLPALAVLLVAVTAVTTVLEPDQLDGLRPALASAVTYTSNWWQAFHHQSYFEAFGPPAPLQHLWSLAVEEQFYLIWPLVLTIALAARRRKWLRAALAWAGAGASALAMAVSYVPGSDPSRVYYGTDTHATALLTGAALALTWPLARLAASSREATARLDVLGVIGLTALAWAIGHFSGADVAVYPFGLVFAALAAAAVIAAAAADGLVARMLSWSPLRWLGIRSYGIYLWHWPVIAFAAAVAGAGSATALARIMQTGIAIAVAAASWRWIEAPILRSGLRAFISSGSSRLARSIGAARRSPASVLPLTVPAIALIVTATAGYGLLSHPGGSTLEQQIAAGAKISAATQADPAAAPSAELPTGAAIAPVVLTGPHQQVQMRGGAAVTAVGDSVMLAAAQPLRAALPGIYLNAAISRQMSGGLAAVRRLAASGQLRPIVVVGLGTNGAVTGGQIRQLRAEIGPDRWLVLVNTYEARPWEHEVNSTLAAARNGPRVLLVDWHAAITGRTGLLWDDGVHPRPAGGILYARLIKAAVLAARAGPGPPAPAAGVPPAGPAAAPAAGPAGIPAAGPPGVPAAGHAGPAWGPGETRTR
jgi:peptidoglycan/LPS O-acetylase OafA/YrhL